MWVYLFWCCQMHWQIQLLRETKKENVQHTSFVGPKYCAFLKEPVHVVKYYGLLESDTAKHEPSSSCLSGLDSECNNEEKCFNVDTCRSKHDDAPKDHNWYYGSQYSGAAQYIADSNCTGLDVICPCGLFCLPVTICVSNTRYGHFCGALVSEAAKYVTSPVCPEGQDTEWDLSKEHYEVDTCLEYNHVDPNAYDWYYMATHPDSAKFDDTPAALGWMMSVLVENTACL